MPQACIQMTHANVPRHLEKIAVPEDQSSRTSARLLGRLRQDPKDQAAWNDFVAGTGLRSSSGVVAGDSRSPTPRT